MRRTAEDAARTREALLIAAVRYFATHAYGEASLEAIADELGVTRGAIYHHFRSKRGLFEAVVERALIDLRDRIVDAADAAEEGWPGIHAGSAVFLEAATDETFRRIVLLDAPAVLGWETWKALDERTTESSLREGLEVLAAHNALRVSDVEAVASALSGAMNELALWIAAQPDRTDALERARAVIAEMLTAFEA